MPEALKPGLTTAIGSLPHTCAEEAARFALNCGLDVPFWPQLPRRDFREWMVPQYAAGFPGLVVDEGRRRFYVRHGDLSEELLPVCEKILEPDAEFPLDEDYAAGFYAFLKTVRSLPTRPEFLKGQVTGPITFTLGLNQESGVPVFARPELREVAVKMLAAAARWQTRLLREHASQGVLVFIDEPVLSALGTAAYLSVKDTDVTDSINEVAAAIRGAGGVAGLHCCGNADWDLVLGLDIDILSFDAWAEFRGFSLYPARIAEFLRRGGRVAFGVVPTSEGIAGADAGSVLGRLSGELKALAAKGVPESLLSSRLVLTPSCGCGTRSVEETEKVFAMLKQVASSWRGGR